MKKSLVLVISIIAICGSALLIGMKYVKSQNKISFNCVSEYGNRDLINGVKINAYWNWSDSETPAWLTETVFYENNLKNDTIFETVEYEKEEEWILDCIFPIHEYSHKFEKSDTPDLFRLRNQNGLILTCDGNEQGYLLEKGLVMWKENQTEMYYIEDPDPIWETGMASCITIDLSYSVEESMYLEDKDEVVLIGEKDNSYYVEIWDVQSGIMLSETKLATENGELCSNIMAPEEENGFLYLTFGNQEPEKGFVSYCFILDENSDFSIVDRFFAYPDMTEYYQFSSYSTLRYDPERHLLFGVCSCSFANDENTESDLKKIGFILNVFTADSEEGFFGIYEGNLQYDSRCIFKDLSFEN